MWNPRLGIWKIRYKQEERVMQQSKDFVPLHRLFFDENLVLIRVAWYDRQPFDRSRSVGVWLRSGAHLSHVFQLTFNRFQHTGVSTFTVRPIYSWVVRLCCSSVNTSDHPWRSSGSCLGERFLMTVLLNHVLQPRSHGLFPYLGVGKRPWERGCVLFNFYSTFVSFCVIVVICLAFCVPF